MELLDAALRFWWIRVARLGAALAIGAGLAAPSSALAETPWVVVNSPNTSPTQQNFLHDVTCVSQSSCWAVGGYFDPAVHADQTLVVDWNGTAWSIVPSPNVPGVFQELRGVACGGRTECWAVGWHSSPPQALIETWTGTSWSIVSSPDPGDSYAQLFDVTCASRSECWAVGMHFTPSDSFGHPLIFRWDGAAWSAIHPPTPGGDQGVLSAVTCSSRSRCWAVGEHFTGTDGAGRTLIEEWNGKSWSVVGSPSSSTAIESGLHGVTCLSRASCWAVGATVEGGGLNSTLVERWDGRSWSLVPSPNTGRPENFLGGVGCVQRSKCWAVGTTQDIAGTAPQALIEEWDGSSWAVVNAPTPTGSIRSLLEGMACVGRGCWAVGTYASGAVGQDQTLILHTDLR
jgi:hypothetical protein